MCQFYGIMEFVSILSVPYILLSGVLPFNLIDPFRQLGTAAACDHAHFYQGSSCLNISSSNNVGLSDYPNTEQAPHLICSRRYLPAIPRVRHPQSEIVPTQAIRILSHLGKPENFVHLQKSERSQEF